MWDNIFWLGLKIANYNWWTSKVSYNLILHSFAVLIDRYIHWCHIHSFHKIYERTVLFSYLWKGHLSQKIQQSLCFVSHALNQDVHCDFLLLFLLKQAFKSNWVIQWVWYQWRHSWYLYDVLRDFNQRKFKVEFLLKICWAFLY